MVVVRDRLELGDVDPVTVGVVIELQDAVEVHVAVLVPVDVAEGAGDDLVLEVSVEVRVGAEGKKAQ